MSEFIKILLICTVAVVTILMLVIRISTWVDKISCESKAMWMNVPHHYSVFGGCIVKIDNKWWPLDNVKVLQ